MTVQGSAPVITYYDSFDRKVRVEKQGFDGKKIYEDTYYNEKGEVYKATPPYLAGETPSWVTYAYDKYGRKLRSTEPAPNGDSKTTTLSYDGLTTVTTNEKGQTKTVTKNLFGKTALVEDTQGNTIRYTYDALGQLRETESSYDPPIVIEYDDFGNKKYLKDLDLGEWHYTYNVLGELTSQKDAKNQRTTLSYDLLGRLVKKVSGSQIYTWSYNNKGFLTEEKNNSGFIRKYSYDKYGRVTKEATSIDGKTYNKSYRYDRYGRIIQTIEPGNFRLINDYNTYRYLFAVKTPKGKAEEITEERMKELMEKALTGINDYREKALEYTNKAQEYECKANYYQLLAKRYPSIRKELLFSAKKLHSYASDYKRKSIKYTQKAIYYKNKSDHFFYKARHSHWFKSFYRWYAKQYLKASNYYLKSVKRYIDKAKKFQCYEKYAKDTPKYYYGHSNYYLKIAKEALKNIQESVLKAKQYNQQVESLQEVVSIFQDMTSDEKYTYFYYVLSKDAFGRTTSYLDGNGLINQTSYDVSGVVNYVTTGFGGESYIRNISYTYDALGNLQERIDDILGVNQQFEYDELNRVISAQTGGNRLYLKPMEYRYDANGNMTYKSDIGEYSYDDPNHVHAVTRAGNRTFRYDANGNMIYNNGKKIRYNSFNKPVYIRTESGYVKFAYDPSGNRYKKETQSATTHYIGKTYEKIMANDGTLYDKYYIYAEGKVQAVHTNSSDGGFETRYLHYDALGSVDTVTDMNGLPVERAIYQPFGKKILLNEKGEKITASSVTNRGYTGHEHIEESENLIHMNGRVYDSSIGRFLSADPHIQAPEDTQSYNRYSYVKNNPLKYTDPSGYFFSGLKKWISKHWKAIVTTAVTVAVGVMTGGTSIILQGAAAGFTAGAVGTLVNGGSIGSALRNGIVGGLFGAVSAGFTYGIGSSIGSLGGKALAHGAVSSFMTRARGGKWNSGFWAGFAGTLLSPVTNMARGYYAKVAANAMVSGTVSMISGGKFANGAFSGAFRFMFNDAMHTYLTNKDMNIRTGYAAAEEKNRIANMSDEEFIKEMNYSGDTDNIFALQMKLGQELNKYIIVSGARGYTRQCRLGYSDKR